MKIVIALTIILSFILSSASFAQQEIKIDTVIDNRINNLGITEVLKTVTYGESVSTLTKRYDTNGNMIEVLVNQPYRKRRGVCEYDSSGRIIGSSTFKTLEGGKPYSTEKTSYIDSIRWKKERFDEFGKLLSVVNSNYETTKLGYNIIDSTTNYSEFAFGGSTRVSKFCVQYYGDSINLSESTDFSSDQIFVNYMVRKVTSSDKRVIIHGRSTITRQELLSLINGKPLDSIGSLVNDATFQKYINDDIEKVQIEKNNRRDIFDLEGHLIKQDYEEHSLEFDYDKDWKLLATRNSRKDGLSLAKGTYTYLDNGLPNIITVVSFEKGITTTYRYEYKF